MAPSSSDATANFPPQRQVGRFVLKSELGEGASGRVYLADDPVLERQVALKIPLVADGDPSRRERFLREAKAAAHLRHPAIVPVFEGGQSGDDLYIASEYVPSQSLADVLRIDRPDLRLAVDWVRRIAQALGYAHDEGIIHRDVKPGNILIDASRQPRLMDFGLAKSLTEDSGLTTEGSLLGTPAYLSPEQARGDLRAIGPLSDQYSLGVVLYELLTGQVPFDGPPHLVVRKVIDEQPEPPRHINPMVPRDLDVICLKCLAKLPAERYASCHQLADDLGRWLDGESITARRAWPWETAWRWAQQNRLVAGLITAAVVLLAMIAGVSTGAAYRISRDRIEIADALEEATQQHDEQEEQKRLANEQLEVIEEQTRLAAAHARKALAAENKVRETLDALEQESKRLDRLVKSREAELELLARSEQKGRMEEETLQQTKAAAAGTVQALRDDLKNAKPFTKYVETLRLAALAAKSQDYDAAVARLDECGAEFRDWEWKYLRGLCEKGFVSGWTAEEEKPVDYVAPPDFKDWRGSGPRSLAESTRRSNYDEYFGRRVHRYLSFSPDSSLIACLSSKSQIKVLKADTGELVQVLSAAPNEKVQREPADEIRLFSLSFSRDGSRIVAIGEHDSAIWELGKSDSVSTQFKPDLYHLVCHPGADDRIAIVSWTGERKSREVFTARLLDAQTGKEWRGLSAVTGNVLSNLRDLKVVFSANKETLVVNFRSRARDWRESTQIAEIDLESGGVETHIDPKVELATAMGQIPREAGPKPAARSPQGRRVINEQGICDLKSGQVLLSLADIVLGSGLKDDQSPYAFDWSSNGRQIAIKYRTGMRVVTIPEDSQIASDRK